MATLEWLLARAASALTGLSELEGTLEDRPLQCFPV